MQIRSNQPSFKGVIAVYAKNSEDRNAKALVDIKATTIADELSKRRIGYAWINAYNPQNADCHDIYILTGKECSEYDSMPAKTSNESRIGYAKQHITSIQLVG